MKGKNLLRKAEKEINEDVEKKALDTLKRSINNIKSCKKTLKVAEKQHKKLLDTDIEDIEETTQESYYGRLVGNPFGI